MKKISVNAIGEACPIPLIKTKKAIEELTGDGVVETLVDNEIAVQNLSKMAKQLSCGLESEKISEKEYKVTFTVKEGRFAEESEREAETGHAEAVVCTPDRRFGNTIVVISSETMGMGDDVLGRQLMKGFIFAVSQQDQLPKTMLFYNGGAKLTVDGAATLEDLKSLEAQGVEILTCGTCLNHYGLTDKLAVGDVTNMYVIAERMTSATLIVKP